MDSERHSWKLLIDREFCDYFKGAAYMVKMLKRYNVDLKNLSIRFRGDDVEVVTDKEIYPFIRDDIEHSLYFSPA